MPGKGAKASGAGSDPGALLRAGDAARDARRWAEAAAAYGAFLELHPGDRGILVQRGHCLKEGGDPAGALDLYRQAEAAEPGDADIHLQIGHALKLLGRRAAAAEAYGTALALDSGNEAARGEWRAALAGLPPVRATGPVLDLSDLVAWYGNRRAPSGIQRVQAEIAAAAGAVTLCAMHPEESAWRALPAALFQRLHRLSRTGADATAPEWVEAVAVLEEWRRRGPLLHPRKGAVIVTPGSAWWLPHYASALRAARAAGARHVPVLHDCGPLTQPAFTPPARRAEFGRWLSTLPVLADGVVAVSHATAAEYRDIMAGALPDWPVPPVQVVPPDGAVADAGEPERDVDWDAPPDPAARMDPDRPGHPDLPKRPFVLLVSSLEPRKNHRLALEAWRMLLDRLGPARTPCLVFAGRRAKGDEPVLDDLSADPELADHVRLLHGVGDGTLHRLYRGCLFTLYPSLHEGWGLPVSESLGHRRVPLAADIPSLMESGRHGAIFVPPGDAGALADAAEALITDPGRLAAAEARIPPRGGLRPWAEVAQAVLAAARRFAALPPPVPPPLPTGRAIPLGHGGAPGPDQALARAESLLSGDGWQAPEAGGIRMRPGRAELRLPGMPDGPLRLSLSLLAGEGAAGPLRIAVTREGAAPVEAEAPEGGGEVGIEIGAGGPVLRVRLETAPGAPAGAAAPGLAAVAVMEGGSPAARLAYLESRLLVEATPV